MTGSSRRGDANASGQGFARACLDLGDGLRARVEELERLLESQGRRIEAAHALCVAFETERQSDLHPVSRGYRLSTSVRDALRGER